MIRMGLAVSVVVFLVAGCVTPPPMPPMPPSQQQSQQPPSQQQSTQGQQAEQQAQQQNRQAEQQRAQGEQAQQQGGQQTQQQGGQQAQQQGDAEQQFGGFPGQTSGQPPSGEGSEGFPSHGGQQQAQQGDSANEDVFGDGSEISSSGQISDAESAFGRSLEEFDAIMGEEQESMARSGVGTAADEVFGAAGDLGNPIGSTEMPTGTGTTGGEDGSNTQNTAPVSQSRSRNDDTAERVEGCNDEDKVARQLCEAATEEGDPFLRAALWNEYNEYKNIILRQ